MRTAFINGDINLGGANIFLLNLGQELISKGYEVQILCLENSAYIPPAYTLAGIHIETFANGIAEDRINSLLDYLRIYQPSVAVSNLGSLSFEILRYVPKGVRRVGMAHADNPAVYRLFQRYAPYLDHAIAVSEKIGAHLSSMNLPESLKIDCLALGVPMPSQLKQTRTADKKTQLLYLGRVAKEQKRVQFLPLITDKLHAEGVLFDLTVVGDGPELPWLKEQFREKPYSTDIHFTGALAYGTYDHILENSDIFILPSEYEGLPLSLLETMGHGVVPVVSDLPSGMREVVSPENGFLIPPGSPGLFAEAIIALERDRKKLITLSGKAHEKVRDFFSSSAMTERWLQGPGRPVDTKPDWRQLPSIRMPLGFEENLLFTPPLRPLRRLAKRLGI